MKNIFLGLLIVALYAEDASAQNGRIGDDRADAARHGWTFNYDQARRQARKANRPLMVVFRCVP